jgi:hypothetical protein
MGVYRAIQPAFTRGCASNTIYQYRSAEASLNIIMKLRSTTIGRSTGPHKLASIVDIDDTNTFFIEAAIKKPKIGITVLADSRMVEAMGGGLDGFNDEVTEYGDRQILALILKGMKTESVIDAAKGRSSWWLLFPDLFHLPESLPRSGPKTQTLKTFEDEGRRRGCRSAVSVIRLYSQVTLTRYRHIRP